nr:hypothetical protein [Bosea vaviloviae]
MSELHNLAVEPFEWHGQQRRGRLFQHLEQAIQDLLVRNIRCELVINGSFLTLKAMPSDIDVKVYVDSEVADLLDTDQINFLSQLNQDFYHEDLDISSYVSYGIGHPFRGCALDMLAEGEMYGLQNDREWLKGYVSLMIWETHVGLRICRRSS